MLKNDGRRDKNYPKNLSLHKITLKHTPRFDNKFCDVQFVAQKRSGEEIAGGAIHLNAAAGKHVTFQASLFAICSSDVYFVLAAFGCRNFLISSSSWPLCLLLFIY